MKKSKKKLWHYKPVLIRIYRGHKLKQNILLKLHLAEKSHAHKSNMHYTEHKKIWQDSPFISMLQGGRQQSSVLYILRFCSIMWRFSGLVEPVSQSWMVQVQLLPSAPPSRSHSQNTETVRLLRGADGLHNVVTQRSFSLWSFSLSLSLCWRTPEKGNIMARSQKTTLITPASQQMNKWVSDWISREDHGSRHVFMFYKRHFYWDKKLCF